MMRKGLLVALLVFMLPTPGEAQGFGDLWLTRDQQGRFHFDRGEYLKAARVFEQLEWKGISYYRAGAFSNAAEVFSKIDTPYGFFNLGNALAKQEKLAPAIVAYRRALELKPDFPEAAFNLDWVEGLQKLNEKEYEDAGGTGGKLEADRMVFDERGSKGSGEMTAVEAQAQQGLSDEQLQEMWMRRVQTTPGDFLKFKFSYQIQSRGNQDGAVK